MGFLGFFGFFGVFGYVMGGSGSGSGDVVVCGGIFGFCGFLGLFGFFGFGNVFIVSSNFFNRYCWVK